MLKTTLDGILSQFNKTVDKLSALEESNNVKRKSNDAKIDVLSSENVALTVEASKCHNIAEKIKELIS
jgi:hypothetical protein